MIVAIIFYIVTIHRLFSVVIINIQYFIYSFISGADNGMFRTSIETKRKLISIEVMVRLIINVSLIIYS
jgi:hypothetical protein